MRLTLKQVKESRIPKWLGICADDPRLVQWLNEATQKLLSRGKWVGTYARYRICVNDGCLVWPRQIETIEAVALCNTPVTIRNSWHEFLENGPGLQGCDPECGYLQLYDRGEAVTFADVIGTNKKLKLYIDNANDAGKKITIQGYDADGNFILTSNGAIQGEEVTLAALPVTTESFFSSITGIQKEATLGNVRIYELPILQEGSSGAPTTAFKLVNPAATFTDGGVAIGNVVTAIGTGATATITAIDSDTVLSLSADIILGVATDYLITGSQRALGVYEPSETLPSYRKSLIAGFPSGACCGSEEGCEKRSVTVQAKLAFIPVAVDQDWILIGNLPALKLACKSIQLTENGQYPEAELMMANALKELDSELNSYLGDGVSTVLRVLEGPMNANVLNLI